jgi:hypothetical protein
MKGQAAGSGWSVHSATPGQARSSSGS